jgi:hypothetical protein
VCGAGDPRLAEICMRLGNVVRQQGKLDDAKDMYRRWECVTVQLECPSLFFMYCRALAVWEGACTEQQLRQHPDVGAGYFPLGPVRVAPPPPPPPLLPPTALARLCSPGAALTTSKNSLCSPGAARAGAALSL